MDRSKDQEPEGLENEVKEIDHSAEMEELTDEDLENVAGGWDGDPNGGG